MLLIIHFYITCIKVMERGIPEDWRDNYLPIRHDSSWGKGTVIVTTKNRNEVPRLNPFVKYICILTYLLL